MLSKHATRLLAAGCLMALALAARADFGEGALAYQRRDFAAAEKHMRPLAESGDAAAQYVLGSLLANAAPPLYDLAAAQEWLGRSAAQGHIGAMRDLGQINQFYKKPPDRAAAERWLLAAANRGDAQSQHLLGVLYLDAEGAARKPVEACKWLTLAAQRGHLLSAMMLRLARPPFTDAERLEGNRLASEWQPMP